MATLVDHQTRLPSSLTYPMPSWTYPGLGVAFPSPLGVAARSYLDPAAYGVPASSTPRQLIYLGGRPSETSCLAQATLDANNQPIKTFPSLQRPLWPSYQQNLKVTPTSLSYQISNQPRSRAPASGLRGPPCKPKRSGNALWVGRIPTGATIHDMKDHFSRGADGDIQSVFLMPRSNCAFVNYKSELACIAAMKRFHDCPFNGVRLVCQLRKDSSVLTNTSMALNGPVLETSSMHDSVIDLGSPTTDESQFVSASPTIVDSSTVAYPSETGCASSFAPLTRRTPERFFIVKSFTKEELEASVVKGVWIPQAHIATALNSAYKEADAVFLIFSVNKSGEFYGYARMASPVTSEPMPSSPPSMTTPPTATAPEGRIVDDSLNGTIFWEAFYGESEENKQVQHQENAKFEVSWVSTAPLPFFRTHGLRNPWNYNLPVKVARDGTELQPKTGKALLQMLDKVRRKAG